MSTKKIKKRFLILDEGLPPRDRFPKINNYHKVRHIVHDLKKLGKRKTLEDVDIYKFAIKEKGIVILYNEKDFKPLVEKSSPSIICVSPGMKFEDLDIKIFSLLAKLRWGDENGCHISVSNEGVTLVRVNEKEVTYLL